MTLYDHFKISRIATFEEIKNAKNDYLENVRLLNDANYTGNKDALVNYTMTEEQVANAFNVLTNHHLKEVYDKYNVFYSQKDFEKVKGKSISTVEKYGSAVRGVGSFAPYLGIIFMALGANSVVGKRMAITGLLLSIYVVFELKRPN